MVEKDLSLPVEESKVAKDSKEVVEAEESKSVKEPKGKPQSFDEDPN